MPSPPAPAPTPSRDDEEAFAEFVDRNIADEADRWDREEALPETLVRSLARARYLVPTLPQEAGGRGMDMLTYGRLCEELGRGCASVRNLVAVQGMVAHAIYRWGTPEQVERWVPRLGTGEAQGAFALTETDAGSDARSSSATVERSAGGFVIDGCKRWISFGQRADIVLVFARLEGEIGAFVVERGTPGLAVEPIGGLLGLRASSLGELTFTRCETPGENLLSHGRLCFDAVATTALDYGRYSTAWGCVGLAQACLTASLAYTAGRRQFGVPLHQHQLVQAMLANMVTSVDAARLLCREAGSLKCTGDPDSVRRTLMAKYFASQVAFRIAADAVQLHGANGCGPDHPVQRHLRDAKVQEIIEGSSQVLQLQIADLTTRSRQPGHTEGG